MLHFGSMIQVWIKRVTEKKTQKTPYLFKYMFNLFIQQMVVIRGLQIKLL